MALVVWGFWGYFAESAAKRDHTQNDAGGILPSVGLIVSGYAVLSLAFMIIHAVLPTHSFSNRSHLFLQVSLLGIATISIAMLLLALRADQVGSKPISQRHSPRFLADLVRQQEDAIKSANDESESTILKLLVEDLRCLRERLIHSLPDSESLHYSPGYNELSSGVERLCKALREHSQSKKGKERSRKLRTEAKALVVLTDSVATSLRK